MLFSLLQPLSLLDFFFLAFTAQGSKSLKPNLHQYLQSARIYRLSLLRNVALLFSFSMAIALNTDWFSCWVRLTLSFSTFHKINRKIALPSTNERKKIRISELIFWRKLCHINNTKMSEVYTECRVINVGPCRSGNNTKCPSCTVCFLNLPCLCVVTYMFIWRFFLGDPSL